MSKPVLILKHLIFVGPEKEPSILRFQKGLNVLYGASETGKSFALEAINYMLGGKELRDIPERVGYDQILLGIEVTSGEKFTLLRSTNGGHFLVYDDLHETIPSDEHKGRHLLSAHKKGNPENISSFLLSKIELENKRLKSNASGDTKDLSFRNLCHLCLVDEQSIQKQGSPILGPQTVQNTTEFSLFKMLLTGLDDQGLISKSKEQSVLQSRMAKIEVLEELLFEFLSRVNDNTPSANELETQLELLEKTIQDNQDNLLHTETSFQNLTKTRSNLRQRLVDSTERRTEIDELKARFLLLQEHYISDLARLEGIKEVGSLVSVLDKIECPLCGALPEHQHIEDDCDGNIPMIISAVDAESNKIIQLRGELESTLKQLSSEADSFDRLIPRIKNEIAELEIKILELTPEISKSRNSYSELLDLRSNIKETLNTWNHIADLSKRKEQVEQGEKKLRVEEKSISALPSSITDEFAKKIELILKSWNFPESERVFFDEKSRDIIIAGKKRGSRGKGMRSITHAAFTIALLEFCMHENHSYPGFVVLDSPLLAYREPENSEDDLSKTDVHEKFYEYLSKWGDGQIIVIENLDPPEIIRSMPTSIFFSKSLVHGRYGLFPTT